MMMGDSLKHIARSCLSKFAANIGLNILRPRSEPLFAVLIEYAEPVTRIQSPRPYVSQIVRTRSNLVIIVSF